MPPRGGHISELIWLAHIPDRPASAGRDFIMVAMESGRDTLRRRRRGRRLAPSDAGRCARPLRSASITDEMDKT